MKKYTSFGRGALPGLLMTALLCAGLPLAPIPALSAQAAPSVETGASLVPPQKVILTPQNARLQGEVTLTAQELGGQSVLLLPLPQGAQEITLTLLAPNAKALRDWRTQPVALAPGEGSNGKARGMLMEEMDAVQGRIDVLRAQQTVLRDMASNRQNATPADMQQMLQGLERQLPPLVMNLAKYERQLKTLQDQLAQMPMTANTAVQAVITLHGVTPGTEVGVNYAYTLPQCGWAPTYVFDALPAQNTIAMRMQAEVWQNSGMDWDKTQIVLTTSNDARREPSRLIPWIAQKGRPEARPMRMAAPAPLMARKAAPVAQNLDNVAPMPESFENEVQSGWTLPKGLPIPEGRTRLPILEQEWQVPLERVARPSESDNQVWLTAKYLMQGQSLPAGEAVFLLDGSAVGTGNFMPKNGEATLFFGADPLVTVQTEPDTRLTGKAGIIDKRQTWQWGWNYTLRNERAQPVTVRLEVPAPQAGDKDITVTLIDKPEATRDKDNVLFWNVPIPAKGTASVRHEVRISAPQGMDVWPGR